MLAQMNQNHIMKVRYLFKYYILGVDIFGLVELFRNGTAYAKCPTLKFLATNEDLYVKTDDR